MTETRYGIKLSQNAACSRGCLAKGRATQASQAIFLKQPEPELAHRRERRYRVP